MPMNFSEYQTLELDNRDQAEAIVIKYEAAKSTFYLHLKDHGPLELTRTTNVETFVEWILKVHAICRIHEGACPRFNIDGPTPLSKVTLLHEALLEVNSNVHQESLIAIGNIYFLHPNGVYAQIEAITKVTSESFSFLKLLRYKESPRCEQKKIVIKEIEKAKVNTNAVFIYSYYRAMAYFTAKYMNNHELCSYVINDFKASFSSNLYQFFGTRMQENVLIALRELDKGIDDFGPDMSEVFSSAYRANPYFAIFVISHFKYLMNKCDYVALSKSCYPLLINRQKIFTQEYISVLCKLWDKLGKLDRNRFLSILLYEGCAILPELVNETAKIPNLSEDCESFFDPIRQAMHAISIYYKSAETPYHSQSAIMGMRLLSKVGFEKAASKIHSIEDIEVVYKHFNQSPINMLPHVESEIGRVCTLSVVNKGDIF